MQSLWLSVRGKSIHHLQLLDHLHIRDLHNHVLHSLEFLREDKPSQSVDTWFADSEANHLVTGVEKKYVLGNFGEVISKKILGILVESLREEMQQILIVLSRGSGVRDPGHCW